MNIRRTLIHLLLALAPLLSSTLMADEGMWLVTQLHKLPLAEMRNHGLELTPEQIYNPDSTSLKDAIVSIPGGTGAFVSAEGLIITNHHVAFSAIQSLSSVEHDYLKDGFLASSREEELPIPNYRAQMIRGTKDVTEEVMGGVPAGVPPEVRNTAVQAQIRAIEKAAKGETDYECRVSEMYNGVRYVLFIYEVLYDVRLVYAPPQSIGNFGGEVDNWYWPRHTGDFSILRAYVSPDGKGAKHETSNVPYRPKRFLPISNKPLEENSFVMLMGFPGRTYRYRTSSEIRVAQEETLPMTIDLLKTRMDLIEAAGKNNRSLEIQYATTWRLIANTCKNYRGTLEGMRRSNLVALRAAQEEQLIAFIQSDPARTAKYGNILRDVAAAQERLREVNRKQIIFSQLFAASGLLRLAEQFRGFTTVFAPDSTGTLRAPGQAVTTLTGTIQSIFKGLDLHLDEELTVAMILHALDLQGEQQIRFLQAKFGALEGDQRKSEVRRYVRELYGESRIKTLDEALELLNESADEIRNDPFVRLTLEIEGENAPVQAKLAEYNKLISFLRLGLMEVTMAWKGAEIYPDANRTLRFSYGEIKPYSPRDAIRFNYLTRLGGVMEKETGQDPFIVPDELRKLWEEKDFGPYRDSEIDDVPVAFLANLDITGGNSGSPVINGRGELVGVAFDGNWEAVVGDYLFQEPLNRSINVDSRYILFILDKFSHAHSILDELAIQ